MSTKSGVSYSSNLNDYPFLKRYSFTIWRASHQGKTIQKDKKDVKAKFINDIINFWKNLNIPCDNNASIINMDETQFFLEMNYSTIIDFVWKSIWNRREHYRISIILSIADDDIRLPRFVIIKGEEGKTCRKKKLMNYILLKKRIMRPLPKHGWCTSEPFILW